MLPIFICFVEISDARRGSKSSKLPVISVMRRVFSTPCTTLTYLLPLIHRISFMKTNLMTNNNFINISESNGNACPCEEELMNYEVAVASRLTRVFALNYFRRDYKTAVAFMDKLWMDLDREGFEI